MPAGGEEMRGNRRSSGIYEHTWNDEHHPTEWQEER